MSYRKEREERLAQSAEEFEERARAFYDEIYKDVPLKDREVCCYSEASSPEVYYDEAFYYLLQIQHAIITRDLGAVSTKFFADSRYIFGNDSYLTRRPTSLNGLREYYDVCFERVKSDFPEIETDISQALKENKERYNSYKPPFLALPMPERVPAPALPASILKPSADNPQANYGRIPPRITRIEDFKEYKDDKTAYSFVRPYETKLFRLYLLRFLENRIGKKIDLYAPYPRTDGEERSSRGRGDFLTLHDGLYMLIDKCAGDGCSVKSYIQREVPLLEKAGTIKKSYSETVLNRFIREGNILEILKDISFESAKDIAEFERAFALDATGFNANKKGYYYPSKHKDKDKEVKKEIEWENCEALIGVRSGVIVCCIPFYKYTASETNLCIPLVQLAQSLGYQVDELSGDKAYSSKALRKQIYDIGVKRYYCYFRKDVKPPTPSDDSVWAMQFREIQENPEEFNAHYHKRSKIEAVFGAIKKRNSESLSSKTLDGYEKEVFAKIIAYNLNCMLHQAFINGIVPDYITHDEIMEVIKD